MSQYDDNDDSPDPFDDQINSMVGQVMPTIDLPAEKPKKPKAKAKLSAQDRATLLGKIEREKNGAVALTPAKPEEGDGYSMTSKTIRKMMRGGDPELDVTGNGPGDTNIAPADNTRTRRRS